MGSAISRPGCSASAMASVRQERVRAALDENGEGRVVLGERGAVPTIFVTSSAGRPADNETGDRALSQGSASDRRRSRTTGSGSGVHVHDNRWKHLKNSIKRLLTATEFTGCLQGHATALRGCVERERRFPAPSLSGVRGNENAFPPGVERSPSTILHLKLPIIVTAHSSNRALSVRHSASKILDAFG